MVTVHADTKTPPCMVLVEAVKDAAPSLSVLPPLYLYRTQSKNGGKRVRTHDAAEIYRTCCFPDSGRFSV